MPYAYCNQLKADDGTVLGEFSSHWAACAAMIRLADPAFRSLGGDKPEDLAKEPCRYCLPGMRTGLPSNACENCMNTGLAHPELVP